MSTQPVVTERSAPRAGELVFIALLSWFSLLFGLGIVGALEDLPRVVIPMAVIGGTMGTWQLTRRIPALSQWMHSLDVRALVALHVVRWPIGLWFLVAYERGVLPGELALLAGWGDIATGVLALATSFVPASTRWGRRAILVFNTIGLVDILVVVGTAQRLLVFGDSDVRVGHPFVLLPMFVVPLVIVAHVWTFVRVTRTDACSRHAGHDARPRV